MTLSPGSVGGVGICDPFIANRVHLVWFSPNHEVTERQPPWCHLVIEGSGLSISRDAEHTL